MFNYSRKDVIKIAKNCGFLTNNTEKMLRLCQILESLNKSKYKDYLSLKGGTAINIFLLDLIRLSVDIDFDFSVNISKEDLVPIRDDVKKEIIEFMLSEGYSLNARTKYVHALDSLVFNYTATSGSGDILKIEINYSDRVHVLDVIKDKTLTKIRKTVEVNRLSNDELVGSKISALINRTTPRDIYDVYNILNSNVCNIEIARKIAIFYVLLGSELPVVFSNEINSCLEKIDSINYFKLKKTVVPVLKQGEKIDVEEIKNYVVQKIKKLFELSETEQEFINNFNKGKFESKLLFGDIKINDLSKHPMVVWKMLNVK